MRNRAKLRRERRKDLNRYSTLVTSGRVYGGQVRFQKVERGIQTRFDGRDRASQNLRHFVELESLIDLQHDGFALFRVEPVERGGDRQCKVHRETRRGIALEVYVFQRRFGTALAEERIS